MDIRVIASGSDGNCYRVSDGRFTILLDAGVSIDKIRKGCSFDMSNVEGCFVTHSHSDHSLAVKELIRYGTKVYMTGDEKALYIENQMRGLTAYSGWLKTLEKGEKGYRPVNAGVFTVLPFAVKHDTPEPVGFLIYSSFSHEKLLYFTDTYYIPQRFGAFDYLIGEVNYDEETVEQNLAARALDTARMKRLFSTHMGLKTFLGFLQSCDLSRLKQIWICHMSNENGNEERIKEAVQKATGVEVYVC